VIAVFEPPLRAQSALYEEAEYGLFIDGFSSEILDEAPAGLPLIVMVDEEVVVIVPGAPVQTSIPEMER
jgi:hypothetical protein